MSLSLHATCPSCHQPAPLTYVGKQDGYDGLPDIYLYNCTRCRSTVSGAHILRHNQQLAQQPAPGGSQ